MPQVEDAEEMRKRILSIALSGLRVVLLDNVTKLGGPIIDAALTSTMWRDRILGVSKEVIAPLRPVWIATGNNIEIRGDIIRRTNLVRLESDAERPDARSGFRHDPLVHWVRANRARLVTACLTILRAYCVAGRPKVDMMPWGRFEDWSTNVRAPLIWAGEPDPYLTREKLEEADTRTGYEAQLLDALGHAVRIPR